MLPSPPRPLDYGLQSEFSGWDPEDLRQTQLQVKISLVNLLGLTCSAQRNVSALLTWLKFLK